MAKICTSPHKLPRFQITVETDTSVVSHICAAPSITDAMDRIKAAYPEQELEQMGVKDAMAAIGKMAEFFGEPEEVTEGK